MATTVLNPLGRRHSLLAASGVPPNSRSLPALQLSVVDLNAERIAAWNDPDLSKLPVYEPGLAALVACCRHGVPLVEHPHQNQGSWGPPGQLLLLD